MIEQHLFNGDSAEVLKTLKDNSIDLLATDPPYGLSFMGKDWDKVLPPKEIWQECYRVLKPGSFIAVMSSPRSDVLYRMIKDLEDAGFDMSFSPLLWTYHTGFPKASDTSKMIDKRKGRIGYDLSEIKNKLKELYKSSGKTMGKIDLECGFNASGYLRIEHRDDDGWGEALPTENKWNIISKVIGCSDEIYTEYKAYFEEAEREIVGKKISGIGKAFTDDGWGSGSDEVDITIPSTDLAKKYEGSKLGFQPKPAVEHIIIGMKPHGEKSYIDNVLNFEALPDNIKMTYPFLQVPKPAKKEKDFGLTGEEKKKPQRDEGQENFDVPFKNRPNTAKNIHATVKPVKLMSYIITLFSREGDWVIDPFLGSGTTGLASKLLNRNFIGVEREEEYFDICNERLSVSREDLIKFFKDKK
jgi:site-specific DNA-methyltransferase (adenine-specific)